MRSTAAAGSTCVDGDDAHCACSGNLPAWAPRCIHGQQLKCMGDRIERVPCTCTPPSNAFMTLPDLRSIERFSASLAGRAFLQGIITYFEASLAGIENIPKAGGALLVANHGMNGFNGVLLGALLYRDVGRAPFWLGEHNLWRIPLFNRLARFMNAIPGEPRSAAEILRRGEIVVVYPGGINNSFKLTTKRNKLQWGARAGFARVAMEAGVPIVPIAAHGVDDMYTVVAREPWIGRALWATLVTTFRSPSRLRGLPVPRPVPVTIEALPRVETAGDPTKPTIERVRADVMGAVQGALNKGL